MNWKYYKPKFEYEDVLDPLNTGWVGHVFFAYDLVRNTKPKRIVELGTHFGHSFFAFCQAAKDEGLKTELVAVDTWKGDEQSGFYDESVYDGVKKIKDTFYKDLNVRFLRKTFNEAVSDFDDNSIDILHIDGLHTYEAVKHDFENWDPKVKDDGIIIFHDVFVNQNDFGVYRLWEALEKKYKTIEFYHSFGLGVLFKDGKKYEDLIKNEKNLQMKYSFSSEDRKNEEINNSFNVIHQKDSEIQQKDQTIRQKDVDYQKEIEKVANEWQKTVKQKDQEIQQKEQVIQQKERTIQQKEREINFMKSSKFWKMRERYMIIKNYFNKKSE